MDELDPRLRSLIDAAREGDDPDEQDVRRVRAALALALGESAGAGDQGDDARGPSPDAGSGASATAHAGLRASKWISALLVAGGIGTFAAFQLGRSAPAAAPFHAASPAAQIAQPYAAPAPPPALAAEPQALTPASAPRVPQARPQPPPPTKPLRAARRQPVEHAPAATAAVSERPSELSLIRSATGALRDGRASDALRSLDQHAQTYPQGMLREERQGLRVLALCALGQVDQGRDERARFLGAAAHSPLAGRVRAACTDQETK